MAKVDQMSPTKRILDAAARLFAREGVSGTTIEDIAKEAGLSRATVYRHVAGGRDEIVLRVVTSAVRDQLRDMVADAVRTHQRFEDRVVALLQAIDAALAGDDTQAAVFSPPSLGELVTIEGWTEAAVDLVRDVAHVLFSDARARGELDPALSDAEAAEWLVRQAVSLRLVASPTMDAAASDVYLRRFVVGPLRPTSASARGQE